MNTQQIPDKIKGSLFGGAIGDALGYPVEFLSAAAIIKRFGKNGICEYALDKASGTAHISDDTQMTLFTANGILNAQTDYALHGEEKPLWVYIGNAYLDWLLTQTGCYSEENLSDGSSWLLGIPELYSRRAPGTTCLSALNAAKNYGFDGEFLTNPVNSSKGCGGIMRVAPLALCKNTASACEAAKNGAVAAAITHGHSLGFMPAAVLTYIIYTIVFSAEQKPLEQIVTEARDYTAEFFAGDRHIEYLVNIINKAIELSHNNNYDRYNISALGEGWVAEETLAVSIYCSLKYQNDFSAGVIAAVNHDGDSDSTGAVTGNILGALLGFDRIEDKWKTNLELYDVIDQMAQDIFNGCPETENGAFCNPYWAKRYTLADDSKKAELKKGK